TSTGATVTWGAVTGALNYTAEYKPAAATTWTTAASATTNTSVNLSSLTANTTYDWRVKTNCSADQDLTNAGGTVSGQYNDSPAGEDITKVTDNQSSTKYLTFNSSAWIQFQAGSSYVVTKYAITSANDAPERDPLNWSLQASSDGSSWVTLDTRNNEDFPSRLQRREFSFSNTIPYAYYRLQMSNNSGTVLQLAEWEIYGNSSSAYATAQFTTPAGSCASAYDNTTNDSFANAVAIPFNTNITGLINPVNDQDYYRFTITTGGTITITLQTLPGDYDIILYNGSQTQVGISENGGTSNETINYTAAAGTYYVRIYGWNGANSGTQCYTLRVATGTAAIASIAPGSSEQKKIEEHEIFPNPVDDILNINMTDVDNESRVLLFNAAGQSVIHKRVESLSSQLDVSTLPAGVYVLKIETLRGVQTIRVMKK
ncbi:MAG: T9SS type A sorting domain-containing protein, partial [Bacteroidota bacterium]